MGKIDTSKITGYANMTPEQKLAALEQFEVDEPSYDGYVKKDLYDKTASELSKVKKEYNAKLTADELNLYEKAEEQKSIKKQFEKISRISKKYHT